VNIKIAGKWMFIPLKMLIGIDPYPIPQTFRPIPIFPPGEDTKGDSSGPDFLMDASAVVMELGLSMQKVPIRHG